MDLVAKHLADIGALSLDDFLRDHDHPTGDADAVERIQNACQRAFRSTDPLKFEFVEHTQSSNRQCILTITKPDGLRRSYATQPVFASRNEAMSEAARIAIRMGALDFLEPEPLNSATSPESFVDDIEKCCREWRAARVSPYWVPFFDPKLPHKQGCALRIQLSPHVARIYLSDPTFDSYLDARRACARAAVREGVLDFIMFGNGQSRPSSPSPSTSHTPQVSLSTPCQTLQAFYDSLPKPFPESLDTNDVSEINALAWLNNTMQIARGGKLALSFFFTSDGPPGLHGCLLKLDRPQEYRAFLVDVRFPKRSDAKAAVCLQAISEGIGDYIRSIASAIDNKITPAMRSFSSSFVYPALTSALCKIDTVLRPNLEYDKERDAFGASLVVRLSTLPTSDQARRYTVPIDYRSKGDAKVAVICQAAEQGVVEFVRFRGGTPPDGYVSPYTLQSYDPEASRKRKRLGSAEDADQGRPARKKKKKRKGKQHAVAPPYEERSHIAPAGQNLSVYPSSNQIHGILEPEDMGLSQSVPADDLCGPSQPGIGNGGGSGATRSAVHGHGASYNPQMYTSLYPAVLDPRFAGGPYGGYGGGMQPSSAVDATPPECGPSRAMPGTSLRPTRRPTEDVELEPGEVLSSAESEFSVGSSRNEDVEVPANGRDSDENKKATESVEAENVAPSNTDKGKSKETFPAKTVSRVSPGTTSSTSTSHVKNLIDYCAQHHRGTPSFYERQSLGRFQVWIVIGNERFDLPTTYGSAEEGRQRVARQVLARLSKG